MKKFRGITIFLFFCTLSACLTPPEFSSIPHIGFKGVEFKEVGGFSDPDSLILSISFRDGDGDIGLSPQAIDSPFHATNFFSGSNGELTTLSSSLQDLSGYTLGSNHSALKRVSYVIGYIPENAGKLITSNDISNSLYSGSLPPDSPPYSTCGASFNGYLNDTIFVEKRFRYALDTATVVDSLVNGNNQVVGYAALGNWYVEANEGNHNIFVKFEVKNGNDDEFHEFDWRKEFCTTFDGRIPPFVDKPRAIEGTLRYAMTSTGFVTLFGTNPLRLSIQVMDRNFNKSNIITSPEFVLKK